MKVIPFPSETTPWRLVVPASKSPSGKRKTYYFPNKETGERLLSRVRKEGKLALMEYENQANNNEANYLQYLAEKYGFSHADVVRALERQAEISKLKSGTVAEAIEAYLTHVKKTKSLSTYDTHRWRLLKLERAFGRQPMAELTSELIRNFLDTVKGDPASIHTSLTAFLEWARVHKYILANPMADFEKPQYGINKGFYSVEVFGRMLRIAAGLEGPKKGKEPTRDLIGLLPWFLLSGFCGLRSCEARRLSRKHQAVRWDDLHLEGEKRAYVEIRHEVAKPTAKSDRHRRIFTPLYVEALRAWLPLVPRVNEFVVPWTKRQIQELKRDFKKATGLKFTDNGLRNSFASYALAVENVEGIGHLSIEMGDSEAICKRHYVSSLKPLAGEAWFALRPPVEAKPANVIEMKRAA